jgi:hypothetical protein
MKRTIAAAAILLASSIAANAACTQADLAGRWTFWEPYEGGFCKVQVSSTGVMTVLDSPRTDNDSGFCTSSNTGSKGIIKISKSCVLSGTFNYDSEIYKIIGRSDWIPSTSTRKPQVLTMSIYKDDPTKSSGITQDESLWIAHRGHIPAAPPYAVP